MPSDAELVARMCEHDAHAFEALSVRYRDMIYRHVLTTLHDSNATEDVVQEVFLRVWTHAAQWNGRGTFQAWLFRIATNLTLNALRTMRRRRQQSLEIADDPFDEDDESRVLSWMVDHLLPDARPERLKQFANCSIPTPLAMMRTILLLSESPEANLSRQGHHPHK